MNTATILRRIAAALALSLGCLLIVCTVLILCLNAGYLRRPVLQWVAGRAGRPIEVAGPLHFRVLSLHPRIDAERVTVGNPSWCPPGTLAVVERLQLIMRLPRWHQPFEIERLELQGVTLNLMRDEEGRANWQKSYPLKRAGANLPLIRSLSMPDARVEMNDDRRHLRFKGVVSVGDRQSSSGRGWLAIRGGGILNDRAMGLDLLGEPLQGAVLDAPYKFTFDERSSGSRVFGHGELPRAFDFAVIDAAFEATGPDLKDLFYLTGVHLIDTGKYHLSGEIARNGFRTTFSNLQVESGASDMYGSVAVDAGTVRRNLVIDLHSHVLRLADLGQRAASRQATDGQDSAGLLSRTALNLAAARKADASVNFEADRLIAGQATLQAVAGAMTLRRGRIDIQSLRGNFLDGSFVSKLDIDASLEQASTSLELKLIDLQLGQWQTKGGERPPVDGTLRLHLKLDGHGTSVHDTFASASGTVTVAMGAGLIRKALAEIFGVDLRGLGLMVTRNTQDTAIHCARARFDGRDGKFTTNEAFIDTDPVLITGTGLIDFGSEALDFQLFGRPKRTRLLRLDTPIRVTGTLLKPLVALQLQGAKLKLIDRGNRTAVDCTAPAADF